MKKILAIVVTVAAFGGWVDAQAAWPGTGFYARGEVGPSWGRDSGFRDDDPNSPDCFLLNAVAVPRCNGTMDDLGSGWGLGVGAGYRFSSNIRGEITFTHRGGFDLKGLDPAGTFFDARLKSNAIMVNGIYELPVAMGSVRPFVG